MSQSTPAHLGPSALRRAQGAPWRAARQPWSPGRLLAAQALAGGLVAVLAALHSPQAAASAAWGALALWLPSLLLARALLRPAPDAAAALLRFFVWELLKLVLCVAMLCAAPAVLGTVNWLALLAALVAVTKVHWLALLAGRFQ